MTTRLSYRTMDACSQLTRYGNEVASDELADVLDTLTDLNDDMHHGRHPQLIKEQIAKMKLQLDLVESVYCKAFDKRFKSGSI